MTDLCLTAAQMRAVDASAEALGLPSLVLMENAGRGIADGVRADPRWRRAARVSVVCGPGNNGGDGFVIARHLALAGASVQVSLVAARDALEGDAATMLLALERMGSVLIVVASEREDWRQLLRGAHIVVDAIFGTGLGRDVAGLAAQAIEAMNEADGWKVAVDVPSGLDGDDGRGRGLVFRAETTFTIGARKVGLVLDPQVPVGDLKVVPLGIPVAPPGALGPLVFWQERPPAHAPLPRQANRAHKGQAGHLLLIAGSPGKTGAGALAARAALRAGAGLVTVASTRAGQVALDAKVEEVMTAAYAEGDDAEESSGSRILAWLSAGRYRALAIGPGIPTGPGMRALTHTLAHEVPLAMVLDADALNHLGPAGLSRLREAAGPRVLTPHPGEAARLLATDIATIEGDRLSAVRRLARESGAVVVLKGARTLISDPSGDVTVNHTATGALATGGSGDVLTGLTASFLAQGLAPRTAACLAVYWHGRAGEACGLLSGVGVTAGDLPAAVARLMAADSGTQESEDRDRQFV